MPPIHWQISRSTNVSRPSLVDVANWSTSFRRSFISWTKGFSWELRIWRARVHLQFTDDRLSVGLDWMKMIKMMNHDNQVKTAGGTSHLRQVANPSAILPSEVTIGITYNDPFFQLSCEETNIKHPVGSRLSCLARYFIRQSPISNDRP